jgi:hypothetical protein
MVMVMLNGVIASFQTGTYAVTRTAASTNVMGRAVAGATTSLNIDASIQPVTGRVLRGAPEGATAEDVRVIYTLTELKTITPTTAPDRIVIDGDTFVVFKVEKFGTISGGHYRAYAARQTIP